MLKQEKYFWRTLVEITHDKNLTMLKENPQAQEKTRGQA